MTEKLYYRDAYIKDFTARVISVEGTDSRYDVILDRTAFFPEEGGQSSDTGYIGTSRVFQVYEEDGVVHHLTDTAPTSEHVECRLDFSDRFEKMQCHTAEHILCGIIHKRFGLENVGFHLGDDEVTFDVNGILTREELDLVEELANEVVFSNVGVSTAFPTKEELARLSYRSKLDLSDGVRIVTIDGCDACACCAPHVAKTGEIGLIKILDFMKHRGGLRIWMAAGRRALRDYRNKYENIKKISAILSTPQPDTAKALERFRDETEELRAELKAAKLRVAELCAERVVKTSGNAVFLLDGFSVPELIAFSNIANQRVGGMTVALSGTEGDYKYVISTADGELSAKIKEINSALEGSGGGRGSMVQGRFKSPLEKIKDYFK